MNTADHLDNIPTQRLIDNQRILPDEATAAELERRGVVLWHYSLRRTATDAS